MKVRKVQKIKRAVMFSLALGVVALSVTVPSQASLYAQKNSAKVLPSDGHGGYLAQVYATNKVYKKVNAHEAWFRAAMMRNDNVDSVLVSEKKFFYNKKTTYANSPSASWPYKNCIALMQ